MKRRYFHGTTLKNFKNMVATNFHPQGKFVWTCSDDENLYLYDLRKFVKNEYDGEIETSKNECIRRAFESGQIAAAVENTYSTELIVIEFSIDENLIEDDLSCENMDTVASCIDLDDLDVSMIKNVYICKNGYMPSIRLIYCLSIFTSDYFNNENFTEFEFEMMEKMQNLEIYAEYIFNFEYEKLESWSK